MSKSQYYSKRAYEREKRKRKQRSKEENEKIRRQKIKEKERRMRETIIKIMNEGRKKGVTYKESRKNISDRTHLNNISAVNALFRELKIYHLREFKEEKVMRYFENLRLDFEDGDIKKGGFIYNKIKALRRFYDSAKIANGLNGSLRENFLKNAKFIEELEDWKKKHKIVKSKGSSHYLKPSSDDLKKINDHFRYLRKTRPNDPEIELASKYHRFACAVNARIEQGVNATLNNLKKLDDGRYLYIVHEKEDKTDKPRIKLVENQHDIKFLDELVKDAEARADRLGHAYLFEIKENGDRISRDKIKFKIQSTYNKHFKNYSKIVKKRVRGKKNLYEVEENFVPHSSRSAAIQKELKQRALRYKRDPKKFEKDLQEMIRLDNSKAYFKKDPRGAIYYGYQRMRAKLKRELTIKEKAMYLTSCSCGHNRIDVMRDHYFSADMKDWFEEKGIN